MLYIICENCKEELTYQLDIRKNAIVVSECFCIKQAYKNEEDLKVEVAYQDGYDTGYSVGYNEAEQEEQEE